MYIRNRYNSNGHIITEEPEACVFFNAELQEFLNETFSSDETDFDIEKVS